MNTWYGFENVVLIIAGDASVVGKKNLPEMVSTYLSKGGQERKAAKHKPFFAEKYGKKRTKIVTKKTEQAHFVLGFPAMGRPDERRYALSVLATLFGKTMSSRLFTEVREKRGLCYYVRADVDMFHDVGVFGASAGVDPTRVQEAIDVIISEFSALIHEKPPTEQEVEAAKQNLIGGLLLELEDSQSVAGWYGMRQLLENEITDEQAVIKKIQAVTLEQVRAVAQDIIKPGTMRFALIGPFSKEDIRIPDVE
jgi:predicted Zn-dependent peptidase